MSRKPPTAEEWSRDENTRAAVVHWWAHRHEPRAALLPGEPAVYIGPTTWRGTVGHIRALTPPVEGYRAIQFGGEEDGQPAVIICCPIEELLPL